MEGIVENGGVGRTCWRCIGDRYLTSVRISEGGQGEGWGAGSWIRWGSQ